MKKKKNISGKGTQRPAKEQLDELVSALNEKNTEIEKLQNELEHLKIENIKTQEHFDKGRKTLAKQAEQQIMKEKKQLMKDLLEIFDNFERALNTLDQNDRSSAKEGIKLIHNQIQQFLSQHGIREMELKDKKYDPALCEIGKITESEKEADTILEVLRKGYYLNDEILRTAMVEVAVPKNITIKGGN
ncbi:MAG: nucleotide exchange factor GrpE [Caldisericota bacterium]|nr:nucleotide exchange factor GrpE [Caldisericota bacterium]